MQPWGNRGSYYQRQKKIEDFWADRTSKAVAIKQAAWEINRYLAALKSHGYTYKKIGELHGVCLEMIRLRICRSKLSPISPAELWMKDNSFLEKIVEFPGPFRLGELKG